MWLRKVIVFPIPAFYKVSLFFFFALNQSLLSLSKIEEHFYSVCIVGWTLHHWSSLSLVLIFYFIVIQCKTKSCDHEKTIEGWLEEACQNNLLATSFASAHPYDFHMHRKARNLSEMAGNCILLISEPLAPTAPSSRVVASRVFKKTVRQNKSYFAYLFHCLEEYISVHFPERICSESHQFI